MGAKITSCKEKCEVKLYKGKDEFGVWIDKVRIKDCNYSCDYEDGSSKQVDASVYTAFKINALFKAFAESWVGRALISAGQAKTKHPIL